MLRPMRPWIKATYPGLLLILGALVLRSVPRITMLPLGGTPEGSHMRR